MIEISPDDKDLFLSRGWISVSLNLKNEKIAQYFEGLKNTRIRAIENKDIPRRVYYDHLFDFNLAAIETPFRNDICSPEIREMFMEIKLGSAIKQLSGWDEIYCPLARLFCMGNYKYRGVWHRDSPLQINNFDQTPSIQVGIYFERQFGFRILKKEFDFGGIRSLFCSIEDSNNLQNIGIPVSLPSNGYDRVGGEAGSILFFDPKLLHQGSTNGSRYDFHMRFIPLNEDVNLDRLVTNDFQDFQVDGYLGESANTDLLRTEGITTHDRQRMGLRVLNSFGYWSGLRNVMKLWKYKPSNEDKWRVDTFANTMLQSE